MADEDLQADKADDVSTWSSLDTERPWTVNAERRWHYHKRAQMVRDARQRWAYLWKLSRVPKLNRIDIEVEPLIVSWKSAPDVAACAGTVKAAIDALVDVGKIPDDSAAHLRSVRFWAPTVGDVEGLRITVREVVYDGKPETDEAPEDIAPTTFRGDLA